MRAVVCREYGPPERLVFEDLPPVEARPGEVVVSVKAASVNFLDTLIIQNKYQVKPPLPFSPGGEMAGVVKTVGTGVTGIRPGARVMALTTYGAFAEEIAVPAARVMAMPDGMDFPVAASLLLTYGTSDHALTDRGQLQAGERLLVLGAAGGVGTAAIEIGKALGAYVIACASSDEKLALCREEGADAAINYVTTDLREAVKAVTGGEGIDVVYDAVGGAYTEPALRSLKWRGRLLVVGFAAGDIPKISLNLTLLKGCSIVGVNIGGFTTREPGSFAATVARLGRWYAQGTIRPRVTEMVPLEQAADALARMAARRVKGKIVLLV